MLTEAEWERVHTAIQLADEDKRLLSQTPVIKGSTSVYVNRTNHQGNRGHTITVEIRRS